MIYELDPDDFGRIASIVEDRKQFIPIRAVMESRYPGRIFVDSVAAPRTVYIWCYHRWAYVIGDAGNGPFVRELPGLLCDVIVPQSAAMNINWHEIYAPNAAPWMAALEAALARFRPQLHFENASTFDPDAYARLRRPIVVPTQRRIEWMEPPVAPDGLPGWPRAGARFKQRLKFGFGLVTGNTIIAYCGSSGFISGRTFMVEVDTFDPKDRLRGHATLVTTALLDHCIEEGYEPVWETTETNVGSQRIAEKLGFSQCESYPVYRFEF